MDQKELLDKIRHSAEGIEIPEQLTPQSVEEKLKREAQQKKIQRRKIMIRWMEAAAVLAIVAAGGTQTELYKQWKEPALSSEADMEKPVAEQDTESSRRKSMHQVNLSRLTVKKNCIRHCRNLKSRRAVMHGVEM